MRLFVLAGGFGSRLKTSIPNVPKALAPVAGVPFLQLQIENWLLQGLSEFTFLLYYQADQIIDFLMLQCNGLLKGCQVDWVIEPTPMDTGGAIAHAVKKLNYKDAFLMTNADTWLGGGVRELIQAAPSTIAVVNMADVSRYGKVHFDQDNFVTAFSEKQHVEAGSINAGLYHLHADLFHHWDGQPFSLERSLFATIIHHRGLKALTLRTDFIDIGIPDDYYRFCRWVEAERKIPLCN